MQKIEESGDAEGEEGGRAKKREKYRGEEEELGVENGESIVVKRRKRRSRGS